MTLECPERGLDQKSGIFGEPGEILVHISPLEQH
jgi:hypothetical protein